MFINHIFATADHPLPAPGNYLYEYVFAGNGIFVRAHRPGLIAMIPVSTFKVHGLDDVVPFVRPYYRVPSSLIARALMWSVEAMPNEMLVWFGLDPENYEWAIYSPRQIRSKTSVRPSDARDPFGATALVDLHSHNSMPPFFSQTDDKDETGFRIYAVIGSINLHSQTPPQIRVRVGIYGHMWEIPANWVFDLPPYLTDVHSALSDDEVIDED